MRKLGKVVNKYTFVLLSTVLIVLGFLIKGYASQDYWKLDVPYSLRPYIERGLVKEVYILIPDPHKDSLLKLSALSFFMGWNVLGGIIVISLYKKSERDNKDKALLDPFSSEDRQRDSIKEERDPNKKVVGELKTFFCTYPIILLVCDDVPLVKCLPILDLYIHVLKKNEYTVEYGEVSKINGSKSVVSPNEYIGTPMDKIRDRIDNIYGRVIAFKQDREERVGKGNKQVLILSDLNRIISLGEGQSKDLVKDLARIINMRLQGYDMALMVILSSKGEYMDSIRKMGGSELGVIELNNTNSTSILLKAQGKSDKTITIPGGKEPLSKYLS